MHRIVIKEGVVRAIYSDDLLPYIQQLQAHFGLPESAIQIARASHVERYQSGWSVDLQPVGGPFVTVDDEGQPFITRQSALDFEHCWLEENWLEE